MIIEYKMMPDSIGAPNKEFIELNSLLFGLRGDLIIHLTERKLCFKNTKILLDVVTLVNAFSRESFEKYNERSFPISIDDDPQLFIKYGDITSFYEFNPERFSALQNPILHQEQRNEIEIVGVNLRSRVVADVERLYGEVVSQLPLLFR